MTTMLPPLMSETPALPSARYEVVFLKKGVEVLRQPYGDKMLANTAADRWRQSDPRNTSQIYTAP